MAWIRESDARARARGEASARRQKSEALLAEMLQRQAREPVVDVFLAHNLSDRELLLGAALLVEDQGCRVHVDMSGQAEEVHGFRARLTSSSAFIFVLNPKAPVPTWVPWAMGFKDGQDGRAAVLPLLAESMPGYRAARIRDVLTSRDGWTGDDFRKLRHARLFCPRLPLSAPHAWRGPLPWRTPPPMHPPAPRASSRVDRLQAR